MTDNNILWIENSIIESICDSNSMCLPPFSLLITNKYFVSSSLFSSALLFLLLGRSHIMGVIKHLDSVIFVIKDIGPVFGSCFILVMRRVCMRTEGKDRVLHGPRTKDLLG